MVRRTAVFLIVISLSGCFARSFERTEFAMHLQQEAAPAADVAIAQAQALKPQLTFPCRVAVYLPPRISGPWKAKEKEIVDSWATSLKQDGIVSDMFLMCDMFTQGKEHSTNPTLTELRVAAARHGANALLVIQGDCEVDSGKNPAALFNLTIIGGYLIPSSHRDATVTLQGALVDVGNGFLYTSIDAEGEGSVIRPAFLVEDKPAIERAKQKALANFGPEFLKRMRNVHATYSRLQIGPDPLPVVPVVAKPEPKCRPLISISTASRG